MTSKVKSYLLIIRKMHCNDSKQLDRTDTVRVMRLQQSEIQLQTIRNISISGFSYTSWRPRSVLPRPPPQRSSPRTLVSQFHPLFLSDLHLYMLLMCFLSSVDSRYVIGRILRFYLSILEALDVGFLYQCSVLLLKNAEKGIEKFYILGLITLFRCWANWIRKSHSFVCTRFHFKELVKCDVQVWYFLGNSLELIWISIISGPWIWKVKMF